jgi:hypothetical protein
MVSRVWRRADPGGEGNSGRECRTARRAIAETSTASRAVRPFQRGARVRSLLLPRRRVRRARELVRRFVRHRRLQRRIVANVLAPEVEIIDQDGAYAPNACNTKKNALSVGIGFTAVAASF